MSRFLTMDMVILRPAETGLDIIKSIRMEEDPHESGLPITITETGDGSLRARGTIDADDARELSKIASTFLTQTGKKLKVSALGVQAFNRAKEPKIPGESNDYTEE